MRAISTRTAISWSLLAAVVVLVVKWLAYVLTHSSAIFADAAESVVHGGATLLAAYSLHYASRPADAEHPYGHGRIAYFSAGFEGALVVGAAITVLWSGVSGLLYGRELRQLGVGMAIGGGVAVMNLALGLMLISVGRRENSVILLANGKHVLTDVWTTLAAVVGVGLVIVTGSTWLDPLTALLMGVAILLSGLRIALEAVRGLMDEVDPKLTAEIAGELQRHVDEGRVEHFHALRCRRINDALWIDVHVLLPGELPLDEAHGRGTELETALRRRFAPHPVHVMTHIEPVAHEDAHPAGHPDAQSVTPEGRQA